jgi:putative hydrolase of the HAD superfamily
MPLLLLDLDNTLVDRDTAFRRAAAEFFDQHEIPAAELGWLMELDASGYQPRAVVGDALLTRFPHLTPAAVNTLLSTGGADHVTVEPATLTALRQATAHGWTPVVVTNGPVAQQERKMRVSGLDREVAGWVVSEAVGVRKPDREIFVRAAEVVGASLSDGGWVVGDAPRADIGGAADLGYPSVWLALGRTWPSELTYRPTHVAENAAAAITYVWSDGRATVRG